MKPSDLRELAHLAIHAADWLEQHAGNEKNAPPKLYKGKSLILFDCILGGKYGIVPTTLKKPEAWK